MEIQRPANEVIQKISEILLNFCNEEETINKWKKEFEWFSEIDIHKNTLYWNLAPEYIEYLKWERLTNIINMFIQFNEDANKCIHNTWEIMIINVFLNKDKEKEQDT